MQDAHLAKGNWVSVVRGFAKSRSRSSSGSCRGTTIRGVNVTWRRCAGDRAAAMRVLARGPLRLLVTKGGRARHDFAEQNVRCDAEMSGQNASPGWRSATRRPFAPGLPPRTRSTRSGSDGRCTGRCRNPRRLRARQSLGFSAGTGQHRSWEALGEEMNRLRLHFFRICQSLVATLSLELSFPSVECHLGASSVEGF